MNRAVSLFLTLLRWWNPMSIFVLHFVTSLCNLVKQCRTSFTLQASWATIFPPGHMQSFDRGKPVLIDEKIINPEKRGIFMQCERGFRVTRNDGIMEYGRWQVIDLGSLRWLVILFSTQCHWYRLSSGIFHSRGSRICVPFILVGWCIMMSQWRQI